MIELQDCASWILLRMVIKERWGTIEAMGRVEQEEQKCKHNDCSAPWCKFKANSHTIATLTYLAKDVEKYSSCKRVAHVLTDVCYDGHGSTAIDIDTLVLTAEKEATGEM